MNNIDYWQEREKERLDLIDKAMDERIDKKLEVLWRILLIR